VINQYFVYVQVFLLYLQNQLITLFITKQLAHQILKKPVRIQNID